MFNVGAGELALLFVIALVVLGPDKLPGAARQAGKYLAEFRRMSQGFQNEFRQAMDLDDMRPSTWTSPTPRADAEATLALPPLDADTVPPPGPHAEAAPDAPVPGRVNGDQPSPGTTVTGSVEVDGPSTSFN